jgi:sulfate/thiosulfate transport system substrate-binding protein
MQRPQNILITIAIALLLTIAVSAQDSTSATITLAAYSTPREAYEVIIPLFHDWYLEETGVDVQFQETYEGSGAQSRAVAGGFEADIVALSLENDVKRIVDAGLITYDWQANDYNGMVHSSVVVLVTREGNELGIADWDDIVQPGVEVITPDPASSGGAQWNVLAGYGAALRGYVEGYEATPDGAEQFLRDLFTNVSVMDASARESYLTFERGVGDVIITYENEYYAAAAAGATTEIIYPRSTIWIENPIAVVDVYDAHGVREHAQAFVDFLYRPEIQAIFAEKGFRPPVLPATEGAEATPEAEATVEATEAVMDERFPEVEDLFTVYDFGGWSAVATDIFGEEGVYSRVILDIRGQ